MNFDDQNTTGKNRSKSCRNIKTKNLKKIKLTEILTHWDRPLFHIFSFDKNFQQRKSVLYVL